MMVSLKPTRSWTSESGVVDPAIQASLQVTYLEGFAAFVRRWKLAKGPGTPSHFGADPYLGVNTVASCGQPGPTREVR